MSETVKTNVSAGPDIVQEKYEG
ncbi:MAG: hypothetical protein JWQ68_2476, partial [Cryobacterium sp.]|nr:hypothetical protein [Cryobacterium sp.]